MATVLALMSEKGGCGKTTLSMNLAASLSERSRVLLVDCDQQASATEIMLDGAAVGADDLSAVLLGEATASQAIIEKTSFGSSLLPASDRLAEVQVLLANEPGRDTRLRHALEEVREQYDWIILDCPPGRGLLAIVALAAADRVILPMDGSRSGLIGVQKAIELAGQVRRFCPDPLRSGAPAIQGIVLNRVSKNKTHDECLANLRQAYGDLLLGVIPAAVCVDTSGWKAAALVKSDPASTPAKAITELARRIGNVGKLAA